MPDAHLDLDGHADVAVREGADLGTTFVRGCEGHPLNRAVPAVLGLFPLLFLGPPIPGTAWTVTVPKVSLAVALATLCGLRTRDKKAWPAALVVIILAYNLWLILSMLLNPPVSFRSFWYFMEQVLLLAFLLFLWDCQVERRVFWHTLYWVGIFLFLWALYLLILGPPRESIYWRLVGGPNAAAAFLVLAALRATDTHREGYFALCVAGILLYGSLGALIGLMFGLLCLRKRRGVIALVLLSLAMGVAVFHYAPMRIAYGRGLDGRIYEPQYTPNNIWANSFHPRLYIWRVGVQSVSKRPWFGSGLGSFTETFVEVEQTRIGETQMPWYRFGNPPAPAKPTTSHNDILRVVVETGIPGTLLWLAVFAVLAWEFRRNRLARACLIAFLAQAVTDDLYSLSNYVPVLWGALLWAGKGLRQEVSSGEEVGRWNRRSNRISSFSREIIRRSRRLRSDGALQETQP